MMAHVYMHVFVGAGVCVCVQDLQLCSGSAVCLASIRGSVFVKASVKEELTCNGRFPPVCHYTRYLICNSSTVSVWTIYSTCVCGCMSIVQKVPPTLAFFKCTLTYFRGHVCIFILILCLNIQMKKKCKLCDSVAPETYLKLAYFCSFFLVSLEVQKLHSIVNSITHFAHSLCAVNHAWFKNCVLL